jgi:hypothetical protein
VADLILFAFQFHLEGLPYEPDRILTGQRFGSIHIRKVAIKLIEFASRILFGMVGSPTACCTEPLPDIEIPDELGVLHQFSQ